MNSCCKKTALEYEELIYSLTSYTKFDDKDPTQTWVHHLIGYADYQILQKKREALRKKWLGEGE